MGACAGILVKTWIAIVWVCVCVCVCAWLISVHVLFPLVFSRNRRSPTVISLFGFKPSHYALGIKAIHLLLETYFVHSKGSHIRIFLEVSSAIFYAGIHSNLLLVPFS